MAFNGIQQGRTVASVRMRSILRVLVLVLALNLAVAAAKFIYGSICGSASMQADGIHSIFDSAGNIVGIVGISLAARPADYEHPYGHAKFETYGSLIIGVLLLAAAFEVGRGAVLELQSGVFDVTVTPASFAVMIATLCVNTAVTLYERRVGNRLKSDILLADASHTFSDSLVSLGVIAGLGLAYAGYPAADAVMALIVTAAILVTAFKVFRRASRTLSDEARIPEDDIHSFVCSIAGVRGAHRIRTRGTEGEVYLDLHVVVDPCMSVVEAHSLADIIEVECQRQFPVIADVLVHIEPDDGTRRL